MGHNKPNNHNQASLWLALQSLLVYSRIFIKKALPIFNSLAHSELARTKDYRENERELAPLKLLLAFLAFSLVILELGGRNVKKSFILCWQRQIREGIKWIPIKFVYWNLNCLLVSRWQLGNIRITCKDTIILIVNQITMLHNLLIKMTPYICVCPSFTKCPPIYHWGYK